MKSFTIKFYGKERHDRAKCLNIFHEICEEHGVTNILIFHDSEASVGYHINGIFKHHNYKLLLKLYKLKSIDKDKRVYWHFSDISEEELVFWLKYCIMRENQYNAEPKLNIS